MDVALTHSDLVAEAVVIAQAGPVAAGSPLGVGADVRLDAADLPIAGGLVPIVTPAEMGIIDADAPEPVEVLIARAGSAVARAAVGIMGGTYGRRVVVLEGKGNNGNDGRDAARRLRGRGVRVHEFDVADAPSRLPPADLVIDAAFGTGFRGSFAAPSPAPGTAVLAVDIPSGIDGLTGEASERVLSADATVSFAALKPGHVLGAGVEAAGRLTVADIGLDVSRATSHLVGAAAVAGWLGQVTPAAHKWRSAVWIVAGSPGMGGAAVLCSAAAARTGAGYVRLSTPGGPAGGTPVEAVVTDLPTEAWAQHVLDDLDRFHALVVGNGLGTEPATVSDVRALVAGAAARGTPTVVDADGLTALGRDVARFVGPATVLTPHDGEFARLAGHPPGADRLEAARRLAVDTGAVVLLKGRATVIATPDGSTLVSTTGDQRLATAGTGDVLAGVIGALLAQGLQPGHAAAAGAFLHGRAGALGWPRGLVAGDLPDAMPAALAEVAALRP
jgi:NAD(P)H-hydrate epimerase